LLGVTLWAAAPAAGASDAGAPTEIAKPKGKGGKKGKGKKGRGGGGKALRGLKRGGCPTYRAIQRNTHSSKVRRAAHRWKFRVFHFKVKLKPPVNWDRDPYQSRSFRQNMHNFQWMDTLFDSYKRSKGEKPLRMARDLAIDWIKRNPRRFKPGQKGFAWHAKAAADRAGYLGYLARTAACKGLLNRKQAKKLVRSLKAHGAYLANARQHQPSNFGLFQDIGLLLLSQYLSFEKGTSNRWRNLAIRRFPQTLNGRRSSENVWLEHSTQYQFLAIRLLRDFIEFKPGKTQDPKLTSILNKMRAVTGWFVSPNGTYALLGDTEIEKAPEWGYNPGGTYQGLQTFRRSGFAMARSGNSYLATTASFYNRTHKHADELDFELFDRGLKIVHGPGNYGYDRQKEFRDYQVANRSHSVVAADGLDFALDPGNTYGSGIVATGRGDGWFAIEGTNPLLLKQGIAHDRLFLFKPGQTLVIVDRIRADKLHTYHRFYQLGAPIQIQGRGPGELGLSAATLKGALHDRAAAAGDASRVLVKGRGAPLQGFMFPGFRQAVPRWSVEYVSKAADANYITTFTLNGATQRGRILTSTENRVEFELKRSGGSTQTVEVKKSGGSLSVDQDQCAGVCLP
jgi:hypothetical protein